MTDGSPTLINSGAAVVEVDAVDEIAQLWLSMSIELTVGGLIKARAELINTGEDPYTVDDCVIAFPIPSMRKRSWISPATGARSGYHNAGHWALACIYERVAKVVPVRMPRRCCMSVCRDFPSPKERSGPYTRRGAGTTHIMRSASSPAHR